MSDPQQQRIDELESRMAFLDHTVEQLNAVVARQDQEIRLLQQRVSELVSRLAEIGPPDGSASVDSPHEIPPHY